MYLYFLGWGTPRLGWYTPTPVDREVNQVMSSIRPGAEERLPRVVKYLVECSNFIKYLIHLCQIHPLRRVYSRKLNGEVNPPSATSRDLGTKYMSPSALLRFRGYRLFHAKV